MSNHSSPHPDPDRLLELAYGEIAEREAAALHQHLAGCEACGEALAEIGGVRRAMAPLGEAPAPDSGLESLLAYAEQSAARARKDEPSGTRRGWWWRLVPVVLTALLVAGGVFWNAREMFGASTQSLAGEEAQPQLRSVLEPLAFNAPREKPEREADGPAREVAAEEARAARAPEQKRRSATAGDGTVPVPPAAPPPPVALAQRPSPVRSAPLPAESRSESLSVPASSGFAVVSSRAGGASPSASAEGFDLHPGDRSRDAGPSVTDGIGTGKAEEEVALERVGGPAEDSPIAGRPEFAEAAPASAAPRRARKAAHDAEATWSVPSEHTQRIRERESLRKEVAAGGISLELAEALGRLCRLEDALEEHTAADATCRRLLDLEAESAHAAFARDRARQRVGD